jgi:hypothetical protein
MDSLLYGTVLAITETGTLRDAQELLQVDEGTLSRNRRRIAQLKNALLDAGPISKQCSPTGSLPVVRVCAICPACPAT